MIIIKIGILFGFILIEYFVCFYCYKCWLVLFFIIQIHGYGQFAGAFALAQYKS